MPALYATNKDIPNDMLLGNMLFYNLTEMDLNYTQLQILMIQNHLPTTYVHGISSADAFRRASSSIKNSGVYYSDETGLSFKGKINVDEVVNDKKQIVRIVGVRVLDDQQQEVYYKQIATFCYDRYSELVTYTESNDIPNERDVLDYRVLLDTVTDRYQKWKTNYNHDTIKNMVKHIIDDMFPIPLMPTGICKFISSLHSDELYDLKGLLNDLNQFATNSGTENVVEIIPILDTQEHRDLVSKMSVHDIEDELYDLTQELAVILKNNTKLTSKQATTYTNKYRELNKKITEYDQLLGTYSNNLRSQLSIAIQNIDDNKEE